MIDRKALTWFLVISFAFSWVFFLMPLTLQNQTTQVRQLATQGLFALAMWGPGLGAIISTRKTGQPFSSLKLNRLGPRRFYLWALFLPLVLSILAGLVTVLFGLGHLDLNFTLIRASMAGSPNGDQVDPLVVLIAQIGISIFLAPFFNVIFALGEELGWRGFLLPKLLPLGQWRAILISGVIWGIWHAPAIVQGLNYPGYPVLGVFLMIGFCVLLGAILSWLYLETGSPWAPALGHGAVNAVAGLPVLFLSYDFNMVLGGTLASISGWIALGLFIVWLLATKRLPVHGDS